MKEFLLGSGRVDRVASINSLYNLNEPIKYSPPAPVKYATGFSVKSNAISVNNSHLMGYMNKKSWSKPAVKVKGKFYGGVLKGIDPNFKIVGFNKSALLKHFLAKGLAHSIFGPPIPGQIVPGSTEGLNPLGGLAPSEPSWLKGKWKLGPDGQPAIGLYFQASETSLGPSANNYPFLYDARVTGSGTSKYRTWITQSANAWIHLFVQHGWRASVPWYMSSEFYYHHWIGAIPNPKPGQILDIYNDVIYSDTKPVHLPLSQEEVANFMSQMVKVKMDRMPNSALDTDNIQVTTEENVAKTAVSNKLHKYHDPLTQVSMKIGGGAPPTVSTKIVAGGPRWKPDKKSKQKPEYYYKITGAVGKVSEAADFAGCVMEGLSDFNRWAYPTFTSAIRAAVFHYAKNREFDENAFFDCLVANHIEDAIIGKISKGAAPAAPRGNGLGAGVGPVL